MDIDKKLRSEKEYTAFATKVTNVLNEGESPPNLVSYFKTTFKALNTVDV